MRATTAILRGANSVLLSVIRCYYYSIVQTKIPVSTVMFNANATVLTATKSSR